MERLEGAVKHIIILNVLIYIVAKAVPDISMLLYDYGKIYYPASEKFGVWQYLTYMFLHSRTSLGHILFNMLGLYFFGSSLRREWGNTKFVFFYLSAGVGAALISTGVDYNMLTYFQSFPVPAIGASGAIYGLLAAYAVFYPDRIVSMIFPPISMPAKYFVLILVGMDFFLGLSGAKTE